MTVLNDNSKASYLRLTLYLHEFCFLDHDRANFNFRPVIFSRAVAYITKDIRGRIKGLFNFKNIEPRWINIYDSTGQIVQSRFRPICIAQTAEFPLVDIQKRMYEAGESKDITGDAHGINKSYTERLEEKDNLWKAKGGS
jgi:hypothetical protein